MASPRMLPLVVAIIALGLALGSSPAKSQDRDQVRSAMHRAIRFFRKEVSCEGGYVYLYSDDLRKREGEGKVGPQTAWIEPPGTPAVGMAYLDGYRSCRDEVLLDAAKETARALIRGQLMSGGWDNMIEFDPKLRAKYAYRSDLGDGESPGRKVRNITTFDDNKSQSAVTLLMELDRELAFKDPDIHEAAIYALDCFLKSQYANGAWPQRYSQFPAVSEVGEGGSKDSTFKRASIPSAWSRTFPNDKYSSFYTLNDNTISDLIVVMLDAAEIYDQSRFLDSAFRGGDFLLRAQLPSPQPGWAQQYDEQMHPSWARKFEPPAVCSAEAQGVMRTLLQLYRRTAGSNVDSAGDVRRFLEPLPRAIAYYRRSLLDDGRLARFYELETNRPLFFTKQYELTYSPDDVPTHYAFIVSSRLDQIEAELHQMEQTPIDKLSAARTNRRSYRTDESDARVRRIVGQLDERGAWVESGRLRYHGEDDSTREVIRSATFIKNIRTMAAWLGADTPPEAVDDQRE